MTSLLSIDPGLVSGWARIDGGAVIRSGTVQIDSHVGHGRAMSLVEDVPVGGVVVIEALGYLPRNCRYDTAFGLGRRAGAWETLARIQGLDVEWVHPDKWQRAMLHVGKRNPGRAVLKVLSVARAKQEAGYDVDENEADAICMGLWYAKEYGLRNG